MKTTGAVQPKGLARLPGAKSVEISISHGDGPAEETGEKSYDEYDLKRHAQTLAEAEEIKNDPHLMKALAPHIEKKAKSYKSLAQLRAKAAKLAKVE